MKKHSARSLKMYAAASAFDEKRLLEQSRRLRKARKQPTSIALEEGTISELKALAEYRGVPYQVLMRMFILEGLRNAYARGAK